MTTQTCLLPHTRPLPHPVLLLLSLVAPAFESPRPEYPNFLLPKALSGPPANSSFTIPWAAVQGQPLITPYLSTIHASLPDPSEISQPGPKASSTRKLSETTQLPPAPLGLSAPWSTSAKLPRLPTPIPFCIQLHPQTPQIGGQEGGGSGEGTDRHPQGPSWRAAQPQHSRILP